MKEIGKEGEKEQEAGSGSRWEGNKEKGGRLEKRDGYGVSKRHFREYSKRAAGKEERGMGTAQIRSL